MYSKSFQELAMSHEPKLPDFDQFSRWLASRAGRPALKAERREDLQSAALAARAEFVEARRQAAGQAGSPKGRDSVEVLQLLAAADGDAALPPEITTPRGFRISLAYEEGVATDSSSIGVLVSCPPGSNGAFEGKTVYLWSGSDRFELGQFDAEGKAIGTLPAGIRIDAADLAEGKVKLEAPDCE
jgi:hypothetical protein